MKAQSTSSREGADLPERSARVQEIRRILSTARIDVSPEASMESSSLALSPESGVFRRSHEPLTWALAVQGVERSRARWRRRASATRSATAALGSPEPAFAKSARESLGATTLISKRSSIGPPIRRK